MTDVKAVLNQLNIVAKDFDATIEFYRRLGVDVNLVEPPLLTDSFRLSYIGARFATCKGLGNETSRCRSGSHRIFTCRTFD